MPVLRYWDVASGTYIALSGSGPQGPQGAQGAGVQGPQGSQGVQGVPGGPGNPFVIVASSAPNASSPPTPAPPEGLLWADTSTNLTMTGPASGDLAGSYPGPTVAKIQGNPWLSGTASQAVMPVYNANASVASWQPSVIGGDIGMTALGNGINTTATFTIGSIAGSAILTPWDTGWQTLALASPWSNFGGGYRNASARRIGGVVHLDGLITNSAAASGQQNIATVPSNMAPVNEQLFFIGWSAITAAGSPPVLRVDVLTSGVIAINAYNQYTTAIPSGSWLSLSGLTWVVG
jgi:hypothetical protein